VKPKRKRGRPKGTRKLPDDFMLRLIDVLRCVRPGQLQAFCNDICRNGGVKFVEVRTGKVVHKITEPLTLRRRLTEARRVSRTVNWPVVIKNVKWSSISTHSTGWRRLRVGETSQPPALWRPMPVEIVFTAPRSTLSLHETKLDFPEPKARRKKLAELVARQSKI
jgi:hypothetical protein